MNKTRLASAISLALLSIGTTGSLQAQEDAGAHRGLEQVIVQARRVEENVQDVPLAITAMSGEQLEKAGVKNISDLVQATPSVQVSNATGRQEASFFAIRGQRADDVLLSQDQAVAVIISGVPMNWPYGVGMMGALDINALEVAKGPQGTLFGKNSTGGAIIITPAEPDQTLGGKVKAGIGNYNERDLEGIINVPLTDALAGRVAAQAKKRDGWGKNLDGGNDFNSTDNWSARASLKWQATDALSSLLVLEGGYSSTSGTLTKQVSNNTTTPNVAGVAGLLYNQVAAGYRQNDGFWDGHADAPHGGYNDMKTWGVLNTTTYEITPELTIKNIVGVRDMDYAGATEIDGTNNATLNSFAPNVVALATQAYTLNPFAFNGAPPGLFLAILNHATQISYQTTDAQSVTEELQIIGSQEAADWIAGLYYAHTDGHDGALSQNLNGVGSLSSSGPLGGLVNQTIATFAQSTWHLTDRLNLTTGLRYTLDNREATYTSSTVNTAVVIPNVFSLNAGCSLKIDTAAGKVAPSPCEITQSKSYHEPTWNLSLDYKLTDSQLVYAATRHGYRSGGMPGRGISRATLKPFDPEKVTDFEIGYKIESDVAGMPFRVNSAAYYQMYKDVQRNVAFFDGVLASTVRNAASATIQGGEVEFTILPMDDLELSGYFSYVSATYDKWNDITAQNVEFSRASNEFAGVPRNSGGLTARYTLPVPATVGTLSVAANVYYQSETALYVDNRVDGTGAECVGGIADSFKTYNARMDWDGVMGMDGFSLGAWGKNLGNEKYYATGLCLYNLTGFANANPGEPRTFGVTAQYKF